MLILPPRQQYLRLSLSILLAGALGSIVLPAAAQVHPGQEFSPQTNPGLLSPTTSEQLPDAPKRDVGKALPPIEYQPDDPLNVPKPEFSPIINLQNQDFTLTHIAIEGNTVVKDNELKPLVAPYENRLVTLSELGKLVDSINKLYYQKGYYTSQAYIPPQDIDQQTLTIKVMEGRLGNITVSGNRFLKAQVVMRDVDAHADEILNVQELQERLRRISSQPTIYKLKGVLSPGKETGQTNLELQVRERFPLQISPTFDNQGRPYIGTYRWGVDAVHSDLTGQADQLRLRWIGAAGTQVATGSYFRLINKYGTQVGASFAFSRVNLDLETRNQPEIIGQAYDYAAVLLQPLDRGRHLTMDTSLNFRRIVSYFDGNRDSASQVDIAALRLGLTYDRTDRFGRSYLRAQTSIAPGWMGANRKFWKNEFSASRILVLPHRNLLILRGQVQLTPDGLPAAELMQIGGAYSVRGYTEGLLIGDRGFQLNVEHRWPVPGLGKVSPWLAERVQGATFFDLGRVSLDRSNSLFIAGQSNRPERTLLIGAGVGLRARVNTLMQGFVDFGWGLVNRGSVEPNAQPSFRVHFGIRSNLLPEDYRDWTKVGKKPATEAVSPAVQPSLQPPLLAPEVRQSQ